MVEDIFEVSQWRDSCSLLPSRGMELESSKLFKIYLEIDLKGPVDVLVVKDE